MAYDSPRPVANTTDGRFSVFQKGKLKAVSAMVITAGTNTDNTIECLIGASTVGVMTVAASTAGSILTANITAANEALASGSKVTFTNSGTDATGVFDVVAEIDFDWDATQST